MFEKVNDSLDSESVAEPTLRPSTEEGRTASDRVLEYSTYIILCWPTYLQYCNDYLARVNEGNTK